jgi:hypothetical protein
MSSAMYDESKVDSYATLIDMKGRFVDSIGRVIESGEILRIKDGHKIESYRRKSLFQAVHEAGFKLVFLAPTERLPKAPGQILEQVYNRMAKTRVEIC